MCGAYGARLILYLSLPVAGNCYAQETFNLCVSALTLPLSGPYLKLTDGHEFTFHQIGADYFADTTLATVKYHFDESGNLVAFNDGKEKQLFLASMPRKAANIAQLRQTYNLSDTEQISIYSLNRPFELGWLGVADMMNESPSVDLNMHPTTDECAPSFIDILRAVQKLRMREAVSLVQCRAGRGRSSATVAAYMYSMFPEDVELPMPEIIERYLQSKRPQVRFSSVQRESLVAFRARLSTTTFEQLCLDHAQEMQERDEACAYETVAPILRAHADDYKKIKWGVTALASLATCFGLYSSL